MTVGGRILAYVQAAELGTPANPTYISCVGRMAGLNLKNITRTQVSVIIDTFLVEWGWMSRSLHRDERKGWEDILSLQIQYHSEFLNKGRHLSLAGQNFSADRWLIEACYGSFFSAVGPVSAAKTLHLIAPGYFPPWDTSIAALAREVPRKCPNLVTGPKESSHEYYGYIQQIHDFLQTYLPTWRQLAQQFNRTELKMIDRYLWQNADPMAWAAK